MSSYERRLRYEKMQRKQDLLQPTHRSPLMSSTAPIITLILLSCTLVCCQLPNRTHPTTVPKGQYEFIVERVIDGDTILGSIGERRYRVRLSLIDAPEYSQRYGKEAAQALRNMMGSKVQLTVEGVDKYERILGTAIDLKESNVALELVRQGLAWCYPFSRMNSKHERALCEKTMEQAEKQRLGIWSTRSPEPPWTFRRKKRWRMEQATE